MRINKLFVLAIPLLLASCTVGGTSDSKAGNQSSVNESSASIFTTSVKSIEKDINIGLNILYDIKLGYKIPVGNSYDFNFSFGEDSMKNASVQSSDESVLQITQNPSGTWTMKALKASDVVLTIRGTDDYIHWRQVVQVRDPIGKDKIEDYMVSVDYYQSWRFSGNDLQLTFLGGGQAMMKGRDEGVGIGTITFNFEFVEEKYDGENLVEYSFQVTDWVNEKTDWNVKGFYVNVTGEYMHVYQGQGESFVSMPFCLPEIAPGDLGF